MGELKLKVERFKFRWNQFSNDNEFSLSCIPHHDEEMDWIFMFTTVGHNKWNTRKRMKNAILFRQNNEKSY